MNRKIRNIKKRKSELRTNPKGEAEVGENNHGIEPESSEQGTFSKNHLKTGTTGKPKIEEIK